MRTVRIPTVDDVVSARDVIARHLETTPVLRSPALGDDVFLKLETTQPTGSFKVRGGLVAVAHVRDRPIVTASAGNHGLGVAYAATAYGARATVVIPTNASTTKRAKLERFAVELVAVGTSYDDAEAHALKLASQGAHFVSPYNDPDTIAGQGTIALELFEQLPDVCTIVVPIGGGGLISGIGLAATTCPYVRIVGVQTDASPAMLAAVEGRGPVTVQPTLADGLAGNLEEGSVTVELVRRHVDQIVTVSENDIVDAIAFLADEHGLMVEGSGAVGVAALRRGGVDLDGPAALIVTGRNIARDVFIDVLERADAAPRHR